MTNLSQSNSLFFINAAKLITAVEETRETFKDRRVAKAAGNVHNMIMATAVDTGLRLELEAARKMSKNA